ncbi:LADA_0C04236g1_1 [Lachancea dasiensis]|uniref:LADA_0C04236g1_1 n=1 Tax=Lachancea dasiensis TaxID=1072105 RepID=A0A1G4IYZ5_9SACH|nr:LADA_0C04236g1_1 [Lachancea dasiensis]
MPKILILHSNSSGLQAVLTKLELLNRKSGPFECVLLLGEIFATLEAAKPEVSDIPILFTNGRTLLSEKVGSNRTVGNWTLLNGYGLFQHSSGLKIGYLTGDREFLDRNREAIQTTFHCTEGLDILLTDGGSRALSLNGDQESEVNLLEDEILQLSKPKYHFATHNKNLFKEALPFRWANSDVITRCFNLAEYDSGARWAYACNVGTAEPGNIAMNINIGPNPYEKTEPRKRKPEGESSVERSIVKRPKQILPEKCRFCFTNTSIEDHLVVHIGENAYITVAKGPLTVPTNKMGFSGHSLLIPIKHLPKLNLPGISSQDSPDASLRAEMQRLESNIKTMNYKKFEMSTVAFEINSDHSIHYHRQLFPVPNYLISKFRPALERQVHFNNKELTRNAQLNFMEFEGFEDQKFESTINDNNLNYLQFTVYEDNQSSPKIYLATFNSHERIDLQFGRRVVAFVLNLPKRIKWDSPVCRQTVEEEKKEVNQYQQHLKDFESAL